MTMTDVNVNGITGAAPANLGISISGYGSATVQPVAAGTMTFTNVAITGKFAHPNGGTVNKGGQGRAFGIKSYTTVNNVSFSNVSINNMRVAPGVGLRITLPAMGPAPIALDFAVPVAYAPYDSKQLFSFFVGFAR